MFSLEDDSEDEEEKVAEGVYGGRAPAGILVSYIHQLPPPRFLHLGYAVRRGREDRRGDRLMPFPWKM